MANNSATYRVIGVCSSSKIVETKMRGAPDDSRLCAWGNRRHASFVIRYMPRKKGWRILDIRDAIRAGGFATTGKFWVNHRHGKHIYPSVEAATMRAVMELTQSQPRLL